MIKSAHFIIILALAASCTTRQPAEDSPVTTADTAHPALLKNIDEGGERTYYPNGQLKMEGFLTDGKRDGRWISFYQTGIPWSETHFKNGKKEGPTTTWCENGQKRYTGYYKNDKPSGTWTFWDMQGNMVKEIDYGK